MSQKIAESRLTIAYAMCVVFGATASITTGVAWGHWKETLDQCVGRNCSCILYGVHTPNYFLGGDGSSCIWVTFGPLIYVLFTLGFTFFHGYRVLFGIKRTTSRTITTKNAVGETVVLQSVELSNTSPLPKAFWITAATMTAFFALYALVHFSIFIDGYLHTCNQYRYTIQKVLGLTGIIIPVIHNRLPCNAIFDFMDYIQPDSGNAYRSGFINTALDLLIGIIASFFAWIVFLLASYINIKQARKKY